MVIIVLIGLRVVVGSVRVQEPRVVQNVSLSPGSPLHAAIGHNIRLPKLRTPEHRRVPPQDAVGHRSRTRVQRPSHIPRRVSVYRVVADRSPALVQPCAPTRRRVVHNQVVLDDAVAVRQPAPIARRGVVRDDVVLDERSSSMDRRPAQNPASSRSAPVANCKAPQGAGLIFYPRKRHGGTRLVAVKDGGSHNAPIARVLTLQHEVLPPKINVLEVRPRRHDHRVPRIRGPVNRLLNRLVRRLRRSPISRLRHGPVHVPRRGPRGR